MNVAVTSDMASTADSSISILSETEVKHLSQSAAEERKLSGASTDDSIIDQWRRSIVIGDVPQEMLEMLRMNLEVKKRGGGKIDSFTYDAENRQVLVTFHDCTGLC